MSKKSRELEKKFKEIIGDIFYNFDKYTDEEKEKVKGELGHLVDLNEILEKYDKKHRKNFFEWFFGNFNNATGKK